MARYIDDLVERWHDNKRTDQPLCEYLGMTDKQYALWVKAPNKFLSSGLGEAYIKDVLGR